VHSWCYVLNFFFYSKIHSEKPSSSYNVVCMWLSKQQGGCRPKCRGNRALWDRLTAVAKLMFCLPREGKTLCPSSGRHAAEVHEVFQVWNESICTDTCQIPCNASIILPQNGIQDLCASGSMFMQFHCGSCIANLFVSQLLNTMQNGILTSESLPVIYLGPPPLLGGRMLRSRRAGPLITAAAAASPLPSRRWTCRATFRVRKC